MSRKILCLLLSVASLGMFSSCKDEGGNGGGPTDLSQQIVGVYKGDMRVEVPLLRPSLSLSASESETPSVTESYFVGSVPVMYTS